MTQPVERAHAPTQPRPEPARKDPVPVGPASSDPTRSLVAALRALRARGLGRSALDTAVRDLASRLRDPGGARDRRDDEAEAPGPEPEDIVGAGSLADVEGRGADDVQLGAGDSLDTLGALDAFRQHCLPAIFPLRPPDTLVLTERWWLADADGDGAGGAPDEPQGPEPGDLDGKADRPRADAKPGPAPHAKRTGTSHPLNERHAPRRLAERARAAQEKEAARVKKANAKLDKYPVPKHQGKAMDLPDAPGPKDGKDGKDGKPKPPAPGQDKQGKPGKEGEATLTKGAEEGTGGAAAVDAWKAKVGAKTEAVNAPQIDDAERYVFTYQAAEKSKTGGTKDKTKKLIAEARAKVKPTAELEKAPLVPDPDPLPEARKLVDDLFPKPIEPDTLPKLDRTPFGTIAELGTFVYRVTDKDTGKPTGEEHILRELGKDEFGNEQYAEIHIVGAGKDAPASMRGMKSEVRRPDEKDAKDVENAKGTLEERVTALNDVQSKLTLKVNPKAGGPVTLESDMPMAAAEVPESLKVDVGAILAKVLAAPTRYAKQITDAAAKAFPGGDALPGGYADEFIDAVVGDLTEDLTRVRDAAGVKAEDLQSKLEIEKAKLDKNVQDEETKAKDACKKAKATEKRETKIIGDHIRGVREDIDHWLDDIAAEAKGGYEPQQIKDERDRLIRASKTKVNRWTSHWKRLKETRHKHLGEAASKRRMAYDAAAEMDRRRLAEENKIDVAKFKAKKKEDYTPEEKEYAAALDKLDTWLNGTGPDSLTVRETTLFEELQSTFDGKADDAIQALKDAHTNAKLMIEQWATDRISKEIGLLRELINALLDWLGIARKDVEDWEDVSVEDNNAVNAENNLFLEEQKLEHEDGLTQKQIDEMKGLTDEQKAILTAYFVDPSTKGDAVAALAAGLVARLKAQRMPVVQRKIEMKVLKDEPSTVIAVANARGKIDVAGKCYDIESAMDGLGTDKNAIYTALAGLDPIEARAIELYYETIRPKRSLRLDLREDLYDAGEQMWGSTHDYDRAIALLDARPTANIEAVVVELEQTMKGGFHGIGTNKKRMFELLRNKSPAEIAAIRRWYKKKTGRNLDDDAHEELDDGISPITDSMRYDALMKRDTKTADALGMRSSLGAKKEGGDPFTWASSRVANWMTRDQDAAVGTFDSIKDDIKNDAKRWGWSIQQQKDEYKKRVGAMEGEFDFMFANEYLEPGDKRSAMTAAFGQSFGYDEARLLEGKRTDNLALISAATISIEHKAILLPSRKTIDDTLAAQYRTAFDEAMWDLDLEFNKRKQKELDAAKTPEERDQVLANWSNPQWVFDEHKKIEKQAHEIAFKQGGKNMLALGAAYDKEFAYGFWTHGNFKADVMAATAPTAFFSNFQSPGERNVDNDKTAALLDKGGYLSGDQLLYFGVKGAGTNEDDVKYAQAGKSKEEIDEMYLKLASRLSGKDYTNATQEEKDKAIENAKGWVLDDFSGREFVDTKTDMLGVAVTPEQKVERAKKKREYMMESMEGGIGDAIVGGVLLGPLGAIAGPSVGGSFRRWLSEDEIAIIDHEIGRLETERDKVNKLKDEIAAMPYGEAREAKYKELEKQYDRVALIERTVESAFVLQRKHVDSIVDTVTTIIQIVVTVAAILAAPFTGGGSVAAATAMWMAVAASLATSLLSMAAKAILKGGDYGWEEFAVDAAMMVIEAVAAAATANLGDKFLESAFLKPLLKGGLISRLFANGVANGLEGIIQAIPGALFGAIVNDATWQDGNPFLNILGAVATQAGISGAMSGAFGALRGFKKGAHVEVEVPTAHDLATVRTSKADFESMFEHFKTKRPGATHADFRAELEETMLRLDKRAFADTGVQRSLRGELLEGVPAGQRKAFGAAQIEVLDGASWKQKFGTAPEGAVVHWHEGKPLVIVPAGTDLGALGKTSPHLFDPPSAPVHGGAGPKAEPHGSPRGASASPDPKAPRATPGRPVIVEPFAGPDLESAIDISRKNPGAHVIATEATIRPPPEEVARLHAAGGAFHPDNLPAGLPHGSVDEIKMRFPLPHDDQMRSAFMRHLRELQDLHPGRSLVELSEEAARRLETATGYGPYALQKLKPNGSMEVVFWEPRIADELHDLTKLRFVDPQSGKVYKFEIVGTERLPKSQIAPHSGFGVPIGPHDPVNVAHLRKVEIEFVSPSGGRGPNLAAGEVVGTHSGRPFFPDRAGGPIRDLDFKKIKITDKGIEAVERHLARFGGGEAEAAMVERLRRIAKGEIPATDHDRAFYAHELRESVRYKKAGWAAGQPSDRGAAYDLWNDLHTATLEDYALKERDHLGRSNLFHPDVDPDAPVHGPTGGRGPVPGGPEPKTIHPWDPDQPLGFRPGERHLPPDVRAALEAELSRSKVLGKALEGSGGTLAMLDDDELIAQYNAYRNRLKVERPEIIPRAVAEGIEGVGEGGRCPNWVWVAALRNAGWTGAVADMPGRMAAMVHQLKNPLTGTPLLTYHGSPAAIAAHAHALPPGTQLYISARSPRGVLHALLGVVQPDGTLHVIHGAMPETRIATPRGGAEIGPYTRRGPTGSAEIGTRVYDIEPRDLGLYTEHKWVVLDVPQAPPKQPRLSEHVPTSGSLLADGPLPPKGRCNLEIDLEREGRSPDLLKLYDDNQLLAAHSALQVELAPRRVAAFRGGLDAEALVELDRLSQTPHLMASEVAGPMEARLGKALATPVEVDLKLQPGAVHVVPDIGAFGILRGVKLAVGPNTPVSAVIAHIPMLHEYKRLVGVLGSARRAIDAVNRVLRGGGALPLDTRAHEAWREVQKLPPIIEGKIRHLASGELGAVERFNLEHEIETLEAQFREHAQHLTDMRPGRGFVAAEPVQIPRWIKEVKVVVDTAAGKFAPGTPEHARLTELSEQLRLRQERISLVKDPQSPDAMRDLLGMLHEVEKIAPGTVPTVGASTRALKAIGAPIDVPDKEWARLARDPAVARDAAARYRALYAAMLAGQEPLLPFYEPFGRTTLRQGKKIVSLEEQHLQVIHKKMSEAAKARALLDAFDADLAARGVPPPARPGVLDPPRVAVNPAKDFPFGFFDRQGYDRFVASVQAHRPAGVDLIVQGSSLSGRRFERVVRFAHAGSPFDFGRLSDYDIALVSRDLFVVARDDLGVHIAAEPPWRTDPLKPAQLRALGLDNLAAAAHASVLAETGLAHEVNFKIYDAGGPHHSPLDLPIP